ncbi:hypothetical protein BmR1_04g07745 [Babesia microti strain RI]|uniref:Uncharacterized protein n=1 Tax=Babesia microti (strain RI) TaxID=1133968 RepID=I7IHF8_BABMR|nr:hypothetical protein BmR1_04g07745 [Babesia microti strain RI]CCF75737.1 hypothetical protein BmR1_04g07745 [Babesia microti strain RI]|eukprot:XP_012650145.1 hypothetical protein BmR1_04g07745 [Babesia microti strain RI]
MNEHYIHTVPVNDLPNVSLETHKVETLKSQSIKHVFDCIDKKNYYSQEKERLKRASLAFGHQEALKMSIERSFCASSARTPNSSMLSYQIITGDIDRIDPYEYLNTVSMRYI